MNVAKQPSHPSAAKPDSADVIADHLANVGYGDLPATTVAATKACILDALACSLSGTDSVEIAAMKDLAADWGGKPCSTIVGGGGMKVPPAAAVLVNAATIHQFDFDDTHDHAICHPTSTSLMPALAVAEEVGGVSGKDLITAVALGNDITSRVALGIDGNLHAFPWFRAPIVGIFGATAAAAKIMRATARQHAEAFGLTLPLVSCTLASLQHGNSSVRSIRDGLCYRNGVLAAELAMRGVRGDKQVFDGPYGYAQSFFDGRYHSHELTDDLGTRYETDRVSLKPWPSIRLLHIGITALSDLMRDNKLSFDDVDHVTVSVGKLNLARCHPVEPGMVPVRRIDLLHNLPFALGATLKLGGPTLALYQDAELADDVIVNAVPKIRWVYDASLDGPWTLEPARMELVTTTGRKFTGACDTALGHPDRPMSLEQRHRKFYEGAASAARPLSEEHARKIIDAVEGLENMRNISTLADLLA